ncbi:MAG: serine/threonine protein kinase [Planctomycetes bacterium]|nr:serine/threonine protein kinase [Planctomycetota bacterium]
MLIGKELGPYLVEKELGSGAMGTVFRAKNTKSGGHVALKLMSLALGTNETANKRFEREFKILKQLDHPNIVKFINSGRYHNSYRFFIMEYVEGESLDHILGRRKRLAWEEVVDLGIQLCAALQHAHDTGIIHRDLKPSNLMILKDGRLKLTDFGIAKDTDVTALTNANSTVGTAAYMSPEQCRGVRDITHKTDLYSMGIMFYELLTGRKPFIGETAMEVFLQHANKTDFKRPTEIVMEIPIWLDTLVCQLMEKEPAKRPLNANAVADSLRLIREKIEAQRSAGVEAATKRKIDRTGADKKLDDEDKTAARALLGKKKKKDKPQPFYTRGWFTVSALGLLLVAGSAGVYFTFVRTESPESLYLRASTLVKMEGNRKAAREGPIAEFLRAYPDHQLAPKIKAFADDFDFEHLDGQMHRRRKKGFAIAGKDEKEEQLARAALDDEDSGRLPQALKRWTQLSAKKGNADAEFHAWGLVGERYAQKLELVKKRYLGLRGKVEEERGANKKHVADDEFEKDALDAVRAEIDAEHAKSPDDAAKFAKQARASWQALKDATTKDEQRSWHLLAVWRWSETRR